MMKKPKVTIPRNELEPFCQQNHITRLAFFGSVLRDHFSPESAVDVLVEFEPGHVPGLALIRIQEELSAILGHRRVDLVTPKFLNRYIRQRVEAEAAVEYAQR